MRELAAKFKLDLTLGRGARPRRLVRAAGRGQGRRVRHRRRAALRPHRAEPARRASYVVIGDFLSYDPYGIMFRKGDAQLAARRQRHLPRARRGRRDRAPVQALVPAASCPSGASIDLPMSPQLETHRPDAGVADALAFRARRARKLSSQVAQARAQPDRQHRQIGALARRRARPAAAARARARLALLASQAASTSAGLPAPPPSTSCAIARCSPARSSPSATLARPCQWLSDGSASICWRSRREPEAGADADVHFADLVEPRLRRSRRPRRCRARRTGLGAGHAPRQRRRHAGRDPGAGHRRRRAAARSRARSASHRGHEALEGLLHRLDQRARAQEPGRGAHGEAAQLDQHLRLHCVGDLVVERLDRCQSRSRAPNTSRVSR